MSEMCHHFLVTTKTNQPRPQVFSVNGSIIWQFYCMNDVIFHNFIAKSFQIMSTIAGYDELCMAFYPIRNGEIFGMNNNAEKKVRSLF